MTERDLLEEHERLDALLHEALPAPAPPADFETRLLLRLLQHERSKWLPPQPGSGYDRAVLHLLRTTAAARGQGSVLSTAISHTCSERVAARFSSQVG